jgi:transposase, IS6 family
MSGSSAPAGYRFPREVIAVAVRWYLRYGLSYRDVEERLAERGVDVDHVTVYRRVQTFTAEFIHLARPARPAAGDRWFVDETYVKVAGRWTYLYRAVDQHRQVIDVLISTRRDAAAARAFFTRALPHGAAPREVVTDRAPVYPRVLDEIMPTARHVTEQYANNALSRPRSAQGPATADARTQTPRDCGHHRARACLRTEPAPRPLREHRRPTDPRLRTRRLRRPRSIPLSETNRGRMQAGTHPLQQRNSAGAGPRR